LAQLVQSGLDVARGNDILEELTRRALTGVIGPLFDIKPAMLLAAQRQRQALALEVSEAGDAAVLAREQIRLHLVPPIDGDHQRLELGVLLLSPGELKAVE